jgi:hypothetical protein
MTVIEGPSHEVYVDEPEECTNVFLKFLRSLGEEEMAKTKLE